MDLHHRLKERTQVHHHDMESSLLLCQLMGPNPTLEDYVALLKKFYAYIHACEAIILSSPWSPLIMHREKSGLLSADLRALGVSKLNDDCSSLPPLFSQEQLLGYLYVIEGSTLGGQIISSQLEKRLGLTPNHGAAYFNGYGSKTRVMWTQYCQLLNQVAISQEEVIIVSACLTYTTLNEWINKRRNDEGQ